MSVPIVELAKALKIVLDSALTVTFERAFVPYLSADDVQSDKYLIMSSSEETKTTKRIDGNKFSIVLAFQRALPESTSSYPNPLQNLPFFDACMEKVEAIKALFREGGALNETDVSGCVFISMQNSPIYRPDFILDYQIFTSEIRLDFLSETL